MNLPRSSGVLLHITSLPAPYGLGDLGPSAYRFVDQLNQAGQSWWQVLPLVPTTVGNSPYTSYSAFAGNPLLISPEQLVDDELLAPLDLAGSQLDPERADFAGAARLRSAWLRMATEKLPQRPAIWREWELFRWQQRHWLPDYSLYTALARAHQHRGWNSWEPELVHRDQAALQRSRESLAADIEHLEREQFLFWRQWRSLKQYASRQGIRILGDIPIFVSHESADVWQNQSEFLLDDARRPRVVAGVPPDYFSETGQLWGNPLYDWSAMAATDYAWWVARLRHAWELFDWVRLDHFRGFEAYWEVPADAPNAIPGHWVKGPGLPFFQAVERQLGQLPLVAEDLGLITPEVIALRDELALPGMRVYQFGFDDDYLGKYHRPPAYPVNCVAYTGTHDNNTLRGWFAEPKQAERRRRVLAELGDHLAQDSQAWPAESGAADPELGHQQLTELVWRVMAAVSESAATTVIFPLQDILGLGTEARMNVPGVGDGNWGWRYREQWLTDDLLRRLGELTARTGRIRPN